MRQLRQDVSLEMQQFGQEVNLEMQQFQGVLQQINSRLDSLEVGQKLLEQNQKRMQKDISTIKVEVRAIWEDIKRLDTRLTVQEQRVVR